jgi:hypothetical protein
VQLLEQRAVRARDLVERPAAEALVERPDVLQRRLRAVAVIEERVVEVEQDGARAFSGFRVFGDRDRS